MIIKTQSLQEVCKGIMDAVDASNNVLVTETLELKSTQGKLFLSVTNREYFVTVSLDINTDEEIHAVISASLFLQLVSKITTDSIELVIKDNALVVKGNGSYKFPLIFDGDALLELPRITIDEVTSTFAISNDILQDILRYNTKELQKSGIRKPVQKMFYIDEFGAITFASGACINNFSLETPVKLLLSEKLVKLFKLFTTETVSLSVGFNLISGSITQTRIKLKNDSVELTAITNNEDSLIDSVPVKAIRGLATTSYPHKVIFNKQAMLDALGRLSIFSKKDVVTLYTYLEFSDSELKVYDTRKDNFETIQLEQSNVEEPYMCILNMNDFKITLESQKEEFVTMRFGNHKAVSVEKTKIINLLPECKLN